MTEFKEFNLTDFFIITTKNHSYSSTIEELPVILAKTGDNGIDHREFGRATADKALTIGMRGSFNVYFQTSPFILGDNVAAFIPKEEMSDKIMLYLGGLIQKPYADKSGYRGYPTLTILNNTAIRLPVDSEGKPDWLAMEQIIEEAKGRYIEHKAEENDTTIDEYLASNGFGSLADTELTDQDQAVLRAHESADRAEFRVGDLFDVRTGSVIPSDELIPGDVPRVSAKSVNNGVIGNYSESLNSQLTLAENFIAVSFMGDVSYHKELSSVEMKVHILTMDGLTPSRALYLMTVFKKSIKGKYSRAGKQLTSTMLKKDDMMILLPVTGSGEPDWGLMDSYIQIAKKNVVRGLRADMDEEIALLEDVR